MTTPELLCLALLTVTASSFALLMAAIIASKYSGER